MTIDDFTRLIGATPSGLNEWKAHCPAHDDNRESLSVSIGRNGAIMLKCHAGCGNRDILERLGLTFADLYPDKEKPSGVSYTSSKHKNRSDTKNNNPSGRFDFKNVIATYEYRYGKRKLRDVNKNWIWQHLEDGKWKCGDGNVPHSLFIRGTPQDTIWIVEGEKDVCTMSKLGFYSASAENGAGKTLTDGKWLSDVYNPELKGLHIKIIPDNDDIGIAFAEVIAKDVKSVAKSVQLLDLRTVWADIEIKNDVTNMYENFGKEETIKRIMAMSENTKSKVNNDIATRLKELHPESNTRYRQRSDIGNGNLFADIYKDVARYCPERGRWYIYDGKRWMPDSQDGNRVMSLCKRLADALIVYSTTLENNNGYSEVVSKWQSRTTRKTVLLDAQDCYPVSVSDFDKNPYLFNCQNGTLDLCAMEFKEHNPDDLLSKLSGVNYNPDAKCERWEKFIDEIMQGDKGKADYLQRALGYGLTGDTKEECFFILYGATSRNGKGTLMESYKKVMGDYGKATSPESIAQKDKNDSSKPNEDIARLSGARFVNISEPEKNMLLSSALIKTLTGNDTIQARYLKEHFFEYKPQFKIFINTNHLPRVTDSTVFSSDRIKVIPFEKHFSENERDANLKKIFSEKNNVSAILNWCVVGLNEYKEKGLCVPESVQSATKEYMLDSDDITRFIDDELIFDPAQEVRTSDVYERYKEWCDKNGFHQKSIKTLSQDLKQRNIDVLSNKRPKSGGNPCSIIVARKLRYE